MAAPTPASTPAAPAAFAVLPGTSSAPQQQQQQQQQRQLERDFEANVARQVEELRQRGNDLMQAQDYAAAKQAYSEALQLDQNNVKVC
jgi:cytochrome c-type biogenesis protein CcmH/NrfG